MSETFIPPHGGYKSLLAFQKAEIVYDATVRFCADYFERRDRTVDQRGARQPRRASDRLS